MDCSTDKTGTAVAAGGLRELEGFEGFKGLKGLIRSDGKGTGLSIPSPPQLSQSLHWQLSQSQQCSGQHLRVLQLKHSILIIPSNLSNGLLAYLSLL